MAIKTEFFRVREDGVTLVRTYSDINHYIERDGIVYGEAIDPEELGRVYTETEELIEELTVSDDGTLSAVVVE